ncbi:hypothetical protein CLV78_106143 [Aliiruegeria haliotis]|uniref:Uncharacterized protein n=1 Tax=Aliiruegeria haliotis TaxID=1280846 RepID=A0A2T0RNB3_9RHOB|nr:hypothetical protein CLV78_106143 [Aliiruegeria haliotis]
MYMRSVCRSGAGRQQHELTGCVFCHVALERKSLAGRKNGMGGLVSVQPSPKGTGPWLGAMPHAVTPSGPARP